MVPRNSYSAAQAQVGFVYEGGGLEGLPRLFLREFLRGQFAQLVIDQRQESLGRPGIALFDRREDVRDVIHR